MNELWRLSGCVGSSRLLSVDEFELIGSRIVAGGVRRAVRSVLPVVCVGSGRVCAVDRQWRPVVVGECGAVRRVHVCMMWWRWRMCVSVSVYVRVWRWDELLCGGRWQHLLSGRRWQHGGM